MVLARLAGVLAGAVSAGLLATALVRDVGLNPMNGWTIVLVVDRLERGLRVEDDPVG